MLPIHQSTHTDAAVSRITNRGFGESLTEGNLSILHQRFRHHDAPNCRTLLPSFSGHLTPNFLDKLSELWRIRGSIRPKHDGIERVGFHVEGHTLRDDAGMSSELLSRTRRSCKRHHILMHHVVEDAPAATRYELKSSVRQNARAVDVTHHRLGKKTRHF